MWLRHKVRKKKGRGITDELKMPRADLFQAEYLGLDKGREREKKYNAQRKEIPQNNTALAEKGSLAHTNRGLVVRPWSGSWCCGAMEFITTGGGKEIYFTGIIYAGMQSPPRSLISQSTAFIMVEVGTCGNV